MLSLDSVQDAARQLDGIAHRTPPQWLELDKENIVGKVIGQPSREDIDLPINEQLIVEYYSR